MQLSSHLVSLSWPERVPALDTIDVLAMDETEPFNTFRIYLDNPFDYPDDDFLAEAAQARISMNLTKQELLAKIKSLESELKNQAP